MDLLSLEKIEKYSTKILILASDNISEPDYDLSKIIIPFSKMFKSCKQIDIYSGTEKIPFKKRDLEYKMILRQEFSIS